MTVAGAVALPVQRGGLRLKLRPDVAAHDGVDDVGLHPGVPRAARLRGVGVPGRGGEGQFAAVAQDVRR